MRPIGLSFLILLFVSSPLTGSGASHQKVDCQETRYEYILQPSPGKTPQPAILLLHGAGGDPDSMVKAWEKKAGAEGLVLIAPAVPRDLKFEAVAPAVFRCVVEDAARHAEIDREKIYLFGYSMGGYLAFDGAALDSEFYAGAAIYANGIADDYASILDRAKRKIPIALYVGDRDRVYPISQVRKTHTLLEKHGYAVRYLELPGADHNYFEVRDRVNDDAWKFFTEHPISSKTAR